MDDTVVRPVTSAAALAGRCRRPTSRGERIRVGDRLRRRTHDRFAVDGVTVASSGFEGTVVDLSQGGLGVLTTLSVKPGQLLSFRLIGEEQTAVSARVRWSHLEAIRYRRTVEPSAVYRAGLELVHDPRRLPSDCPPPWRDAIGRLPAGRAKKPLRRQNGRKVDL